MKTALKWLLILFQGVLLIVPLALYTYGTQSMGFYRHIVYTSKEYTKNFLTSELLTAGTFFFSALVLLFPFIFFVFLKKKGKHISYITFWILELFTAILALFTLPQWRSIFAYPYLFFCFTALWLLQLALLFVTYKKQA